MFDHLAVITVNIDLKDDTAECIESLIKAGLALNQLIVVDNGSTDGSIPFLRGKFGSELNIIDARENGGYAYGLNLGIDLAMKQGAEWFLLMNNDTVVADDFIAEMEMATKCEAFSLFGPMIYYYNKPDTIWYLGDRLINGTLITVNPYRGKVDDGSIADPLPVDFVHGCAMMVKRNVFETIGLLDASSLVYAEEVDFCWRARLARFRMAAVPKAHLWHKISRSANRQKPRTRYFRTRNQIRFYRRYSTPLQLPMMVLFTMARSLYILMMDIAHGHIDMITPLVSGWWDGWLATGKERS